MTEDKKIEPTLGWRLVLVAALSNMFFKCAMVVIIGNRWLSRMVILLFSILVITGIAILFLWP